MRQANQGDISGGRSNIVECSREIAEAAHSSLHHIQYLRRVDLRGRLGSPVRLPAQW